MIEAPEMKSLPALLAPQLRQALALFLDELQYVEESQLAALISGLHRTTQLQLPVILVGAGLPQLRGPMGNAKSYAERLFDFPTVGLLSAAALARAISKPLHKQGVYIEAEALGEIQDSTRGYPYFVQEWGKHAWDVAIQSPITLADVRKASVLAIAAMDESFFRVRFDRLTPMEKRYLRSMSDLGPGPHRSRDISDRLGREVNKLSMTRTNLITKGMIGSPSHGDTAFTVPMFDEFMRRVMPGNDW